ncbi:MAG: hypothetical protein Q7T82_20510 [Armatimonadota bacterium]|nr:hypothetical protein [Armatimonadota bacterium]
MVRTEITEQSILGAIARGDYALALTGAFSYLDGSLGGTRGMNRKKMVGAIREHMRVFTKAMTGGSITIGSIHLLYSKLTPIEDILYDIRCNIQHDAKVDVVELTEEGRITVTPQKVEMPLGIILGLVAVAKAIAAGNAGEQQTE